MAATPKTFTDGSTDLDEANLNLMVRGGKLQVKVNYFEMKFTASTNIATVVSTTDSDGEVITADMSWDAGNKWVAITLSGFTAPPVAIATLKENASTNVEKIFVWTSSSTTLRVRFISNATPGVSVDPDGNMNVMVMIIGA